ncbi:DUF1987 domain-containing protein [Desulfovibrio aerotolerans]|uniref:DUF1987 domain-containing protein n=1 Tax=Solidesulfovibrio aerotolerans TaxID=295255 RepID=A0A7C9ITV3_9BACT|nr:DUF1987 domain-containing protein [Solidesulfovibrio aerotolerans]MYL85007.1 DUF1987 domain-containing protein [Solidesulfovibrio aerotolerans]
MSIIHIEATERSPELHFDFDANEFYLRGESYPEDIKEFYGSPITQLQDHLGAIENAALQFTFHFLYFNSSTAKIIMGLFDLLDAAAARGNRVDITWAFEKDDDNLEELGEEFGEDLKHASFKLVAR